MVKKSKQFENLNYLKTLSAEDAILKESINNINSYIFYLKNNFPVFYENFYTKNFLTKINEKNIYSQDSKKTIEFLKILFNELEIKNEKFDAIKIKNSNFEYTQNSFLFGELLKDLLKPSRNIRKTCNLCEVFIRTERNNKRYKDFLAPDGYDHFLKAKNVVEPYLLEADFLELSKYNTNLNNLIEKKKYYFLNKQIKSVNYFVFYSDFNSFCIKFMHAKGIKSIKEKIKIISQGNSIESENFILNFFLYKNFLTYVCLEKLLVTASYFGKELFGNSKNKLAECGTSIARYDDYFIDKDLSYELRKIMLVEKMQFQDYFGFGDEHNKDLFFQFMSGKSNSILIPLRIFRHFFVNGQLFVCNRNNLKIPLISQEEEELIFLMNSKILNWCSSRFKKCMGYYTFDQV